MEPLLWRVRSRRHGYGLRPHRLRRLAPAWIALAAVLVAAIRVSIGLASRDTREQASADATETTSTSTSETTSTTGTEGSTVGAELAPAR